MNTFDDLRKLKKNWNDYNADPLNPEYIDTAEELFTLLDAGFEVFPLADGGVQIEYEDENIYIEFVVENKVTSYWRKNGSEESCIAEGEETFSKDSLVFISEFARFLLQ